MLLTVALPCRTTIQSVCRAAPQETWDAKVRNGLLALIERIFQLVKGLVDLYCGSYLQVTRCSESSKLLHLPCLVLRLQLQVPQFSSYHLIWLRL